MSLSSFLLSSFSPFSPLKNQLYCPHPLWFHVPYSHETILQNPCKYWLYNHSSYHYTLFYTTAASSFSLFHPSHIHIFNQKHCTPSIFKGLGKKPERRRTIKTQLLTGNTDEENESFLPSSFTFFFKKVLETQRFQGLKGNWEEEGDEEDFTGSSSVVDGIGKKEKTPEEKRKKLFYPKVLYF